MGDFKTGMSLKNEPKLAAMVYEVSSAAIVIMDKQFNVLNANPAFSDITGFNLVEIVGRPFTNIYDISLNQVTHKEMISSANEKGGWRGELFIRRKNNNCFPGMILINGKKQFNGEISHYVMMILDISEHKEFENELRYQAETDPLTHLANRKLFTRKLEATILSAKRFNYTVALLYLDLDGFKQINDSLGHGYGDKVLIDVSRVLLDCVREVDTVARLGGDEFVVILNGTSKEMIAITAQRIIDTMILSVNEKETKAPVSVSIGIAVYPGDSTCPLTVLQYADEAMYRAKYKGKGQFCWHEDSLK